MEKHFRTHFHRHHQRLIRSDRLWGQQDIPADFCLHSLLMQDIAFDVQNYGDKAWYKKFPIALLLYDRPVRGS